MNAVFEKRLALVWLALSAVSVLSWWLGTFQVHDVLQPSATITFAVIGIALAKVRVIMREFMEVRHAPALLCRLTEIWLVLTAVGILGTYFVGMAYLVN